MENINDLINQIVQISHSNLPAESQWESFTVEDLTLRMFTEINAFYVNENGQKISFNPKMRGNYDKKTDLTFLFSDLRKAMYDLSPNMGAWFTCTIKVERDGEFKATYNYDDKPNFIDDIVDEFFIDDLQQFPRQSEQIPDWLKEILARNKTS